MTGKRMLTKKIHIDDTTPEEATPCEAAANQSVSIRAGSETSNQREDPPSQNASRLTSFFTRMKTDWRLLHTLATVELLLLTAAVLVSVYSMSINIQRQHEMKTIDLMGHFQDRYDELIWEVADHVTDTEKAENYFSRYWNLQLEQYEYWKQDLIADDIYAYWMGLRRALYNDPHYRPFKLTLPEYTYQQGWQHAQKDLRVTVHPYDFGDFMNDVMTTDRPIRDIFSKHKNH
jgi:hypothetical protein